MRSYHRWAGAVAALFLAFIALTGIGLQLDLWITGHAPPGTDEKVQPPSGLALPSDEQLSRIVTAAADAVRRRHPSLSAEHLEVVFVGPGARVVVGSLTPFGPHVTVDPETGRDIPEPKIAVGYHGILQDLHAGYLFGQTGRIISTILGVALLVLSITGIKVYIDLLRHRWRAGRKHLFW